MDWSDTEAKGLREVIGAEMAERILRGCNVHWARSYQRVAARVNKAVNQSHYQLAVEAFCLVARQISICNTKEGVLKLFNVLQGALPLCEVADLVAQLREDHFAAVSCGKCDWSCAKAWASWWLRPRHLQMLAKPFTKMS